MLNKYFIFCFNINNALSRFKSRFDIKSRRLILLRIIKSRRLILLRIIKNDDFFLNLYQVYIK